jgi:hypothetical protein
MLITKIAQLASCHFCQLKKSRKPKPPLRPIPAEDVYSHLQVDLIEMPISKRGNKYAVNIIDIFSKYAFGFPIPMKTANEVAHALSGVVSEHGKFRVLQHDQGSEFNNKEITSFCEANGIG